MRRPTGAEIGRFQKANAFRYGRCLHGGDLACDAPAIRAHSIQNSGTLDLLVNDGHVITPRMRTTMLGPSVSFELIGRNQASTFSGLCGPHDSELFRLLDTQPFDMTNKEQLFQLAYRSVMHELHATLEAGVKIQGAYLDRVKRGLDPADAPSDAGMEAVGYMITAYATYEYRQKVFETVRRSRKFNQIQHDTFVIDAQAPVVAVSSLFSIAEPSYGDHLTRCVLNVFPTSPAETVVVLSYAPAEKRAVRAALAPLYQTAGDSLKLEVSRLILDRTSNFVLSPQHYALWTDDKKLAVTRAFLKSIARVDAGGNVMGPATTYQPLDADPELMLF